MSGWYSNIVGATTSKISNLQRSYFSGEADGDTEDDTHVCRVLRSYYTEKGKPFPGWLPPDPKAPPPATAVYSQPSQLGSRYGGLGQQQQQQGGGSLSSLWDNNPTPQQSQAPPSLRTGRGVRGSDARESPFRNSEDAQARPLPSQRAGSFQNQGAFGGSATPPASSSGGSAQDRLKQRLFGGSRTASPAASGPFQPPPQRGGGNSSGDYEDRFAPGGMYDAGGNRGGGDRPFMSSNSPWSNEPNPSSGGRPGGRRPVGLPSGPRMR
ncbi:Sec1-binding region of Mso1-domain-containing protein [Xylaria arbuscula]|nr:Sec1-binding region of Mso1-domain-containing protein [Xylaria arbuscula]